VNKIYAFLETKKGIFYRLELCQDKSAVFLQGKIHIKQKVMVWNFPLFMWTWWLWKLEANLTVCSWSW